MLYSALLLGLISSLHCMGMCGPIAMMLPVDHNNPAKKASQILLYHLGRLTAYGTLGLALGILGRGFYLAGMQQQLSIIAGILMIAIVMIPEKVFSNYNFSKPVYRIISKVKTSLGSQFKKRTYKALFVTGLLNGFLPCGLVYAALFGAIAMQNVPLGMLYMLLYGVGTIPLMSVVVYASAFLTNPMRNTMVKIVPYVAVFIGMLFIVRGLGLSIPYLSPGTISLFVQQAPHCR
ncbi:sulfite exporter TauE/SafE family protein [Flavobacterium subsaxonicum]|uniref:Membrane protein n=1 Tax=Flavobacterium subsaxonicum WB 4.1-42 = DSM 21790 TaxID=1121898 RepID=A0A0A2MRH2_9FLAO|nr:sulfite exporter TauE/SafE family protein [Flavobacterium subsaxonicum]KGO94949.1 membrane protein [Flavobacterium subsaxonicum WB 4.1-42 = DSM 21790]